MPDAGYRVAYVAADGVGSTVFEAQVRRLTGRLRAFGLPTQLLVIQPWIRLLRPQTFKAFLSGMLFSSEGISINCLAPDFRSRSRLSAFASSFAGRTVDSLGSGILILHCRGPEAALIGLELAKRRRHPSRVVCDVRGLAIEEARQSAPLKAAYLSEVERHVLPEVDACSFVSAELRDIYTVRYGLETPRAVNLASYDDMVFSIDDCARQAVRQRMKWHDETVLVYAGGTQEYQSLPRVMQAFRQLSRNTKKAHLLLLTVRPIRRLGEELAGAGIGGSEVSYIRGVAHEAMLGYLNAADWGLAFRRPDPVNDVATPTKIAEYLGCGLPVILGGRTALYPQLIAENSILGTVLPFSSNLESVALSRRSREQREQIAVFARANLSMSIVISQYRQLYEQLIA